MSGSGGFWCVGAEGAGLREGGLLEARWKISVSDRNCSTRKHGGYRKDTLRCESAPSGAAC